MDNKKNITIRDVACLADVSIATVSRVLNNPSIVKKETVEKVNNAIRELKFTCNSLHLREIDNNSVNEVVIIFMPNIFTEDLAEIANGALEELANHNIDSLIWNSNENRFTEKRGLSVLSQDYVKGVIFITSCVEDPFLRDITAKMPVAAVERTITEPFIDLINVDSEQGMGLLVDHLHELGHENIGLLCGDFSSSNSLIKSMAFKKALEKNSIQWDASSVISTGWSVQSGFQGVKQLLSWRPDTTAVICITDVLAYGAINALHSMGLACPGQVSITGFDNAPSSAYQWPPLTTLDFPCYEMGRAAAGKIINRLNDPHTPTETVLLPMKLIVRDSTGIAPQK